MSEDRTDEMLKAFKENPEIEEDLELLANEFYKNLDRDDCEWGAIGLDCKRPFGNSDMPSDVADICGVEKNYDKNGEWDNEDYCIYLYYMLPTCLRYKWNKI